MNELAKTNKKIKIIKIDVSNDQSINEAAQQVESIVGCDGINLLINNSGILQNVLLFIFFKLFK